MSDITVAVIGCKSVTKSNGGWAKSDDIADEFETLWCKSPPLEFVFQEQS